MFKAFDKILVVSVLLSLVLFGLAPFAIPQKVEPWTNRGPYGGMISDIAIDPSNPNKMFAGTYMGDGLYVTMDGGSKWQAVEDTFKDRIVWAVKIAPMDNNVIWVAHNCDVEKSADGGGTWTHIENRDMQWDCENCGGQEDANRWCTCLAVDPFDARTVYVGTSGPNGDDSGGAIYKTEDGGKTWTKTNQGNDFDYRVVDIDIDPQNADIIWAVTKDSAGTLYRSEDRGESWKNILTINTGFTTVAVKPNHADTVFTGSRYGIIKHYFDGDKWQYLWPVIPKDIGCRSVRDMTFDPQNPEVLYAAWSYDSSGDRVRKVSRSTNGGIDWETYTVKYMFTSLAVHPKNSEVIFGGERYAGVYKSENHGQAWFPVNNGIDAYGDHIYDIAIDPKESGHILAGTIPGVYETKPGEGWSLLLPKVTYSLQFHPTESLTFYAGTKGYLAKTTDGGLSWT